MKLALLKLVIAVGLFATTSAAVTASAQDLCAPLFSETKTFWSSIRDRIPGLRVVSAEEAFQKITDKALKAGKKPQVLVGEHSDSRFEVFGWADFKSLNFMDQTVDVVLYGKPMTFPMDSVFIPEKFRRLGGLTMGYRTDETGLRRLYIYNAFSPNGYVLASSYRGRDDSGFDAFPREQFQAVTEKQLEQQKKKK